MPRPYEAKGYPYEATGYPFLLVLLIDASLLGAVTWADPKSGAYMFLLVGICIPIHLWPRRRRGGRYVPA